MSFCENWGGEGGEEKEKEILTLVFELKRRKMKGLMAEFDTIETPMKA